MHFKMLTPLRTTKYERDARRMFRRGKNFDRLDHVIDLLCNEIHLPEQYHDHPLHGDWEGYRECHIEPDWLLVYKIEEKKLILVLTRTGSHADIF